MARPIRILGIDPGLRRTGWGVIEVDGNRLIFVACGSAQTDDKAALGERLVAIHDGLRRVVDAFRPDEAAVEATFVNKDAAATLKLGQARGIAMLVPAQGRPAGRRIRPQSGQEDHRGRRPRREGADPHDARRAAAEGRSALPRCRRRARHRHHPCASPAERGAEGGSAMIGKLTGTIDSYGEDFIIVDVNGVGYLVHCSARTLQALPAPGEAVTLSIETHVREDQIRLFGFALRRRARMVPAAADRAGRRHQGGAVGPQHAEARRSRLCDRRARQGDDDAHARRRPQGGRTHRHRVQGQGAGLAEVDPAVVRLSGAVADRRAPQPVPTRSRRWSISAMVSRRPPPRSRPRCASAGEGADTKSLIRLGLKELAK